MAKFYTGKHKLDGQVEEFDMSTLPEGRLTLPVGAVKNVSEISDAVKVIPLKNCKHAISPEKALFQFPPQTSIGPPLVAFEPN